MELEYLSFFEVILFEVRLQGGFVLRDGRKGLGG
jgi:hypothetical protein